jgi:hypothetical protein
MTWHAAHVNDLNISQYLFRHQQAPLKNRLQSTGKRAYIKRLHLQGADMKGLDTPELTPDSIRETAIAFQRSRILLTAFELGVFTALGDMEKTAVETALTLGVDPGAAGRLMNALCALGYLEKTGTRYKNTLSSRKYLVEGSPDYQAGLGHLANLWKSWSTLTEAVRKGGPAAEQAFPDRGDEWLRSFIAAMHDRAGKQAAAVAGMLDLSGVSRLLDVGGGSGAFSMAFARKEAALNATVFDLPNVTKLTREYVEREGLSSRISTLNR